MANSHDNALNDEGFHEIQLSGKQLVFAFMLTTLVAVAIFLLGVQVGRGVKSERAASGEVADNVATAPPPAASAPSQPAASSGPPAAEPPAPAQEPDDELSYAKRLQGGNAGAQDKVSPAPAAQATTAKETPAPVASPKTAAPKQAAAAAPVDNGKPGQWIVQLAAIQDRVEAANIAQRLGGKGYPAFVLDPAPGAPVIYRVQVGGYPDREKADQAARKLEKDEHFKPYVRSR